MVFNKINCECMKLFNDVATYRDLSIFVCGKEECVKDKAISLTKKKYHLFHFVISGKGNLILNGKKYELQKGMMFFIPKENDAVYYPDKDNPWSYEWVGFNGEKVDEYLEYLNINIENPIVGDLQKQFKHIFDGIVNRYSTSGYIDLSAIGYLYQLFGELIYLKNGKDEISTSKVTIQLAKDFIYNNYQFDINIVDVAKNANVTPNYLSSIFNKQEGMSTKKFLTKVRMERAIILLETGQFSVKEVGEMVGYPNQLHFSGEFKKYYGSSPMHYMNGGKKENEQK